MTKPMRACRPRAERRKVQTARPRPPDLPFPPVGTIRAEGTVLDGVRARVDEVLPDDSLVVRLMSARGEYQQGERVRVGRAEFLPD